MDDEARLNQLQEKLDEVIEITEENNQILRSMERTARWSFWGKLLIWVVVLILPFIFLGPLLKALVPSLGASSARGLFGLPSEQQLKTLLDSYNQGAGSTTEASGT